MEGHLRQAKGDGEKARHALRALASNIEPLVRLREAATPAEILCRNLEVGLRLFKQVQKSGMLRDQGFARVRFQTCRNLAPRLSVHLDATASFLDELPWQVLPRGHTLSPHHLFASSFAADRL